MPSVFKRSSDRGKKGAPWYMRYKDADGRWRTKKGCVDKAATERMANKLEADAAQCRAGLVDPKEAARRRHEARPLSGHLDDWKADLSGRGNTAKHADLSRSRAGRVVEFGDFVRDYQDLADERAGVLLRVLRIDSNVILSGDLKDDFHALLTKSRIGAGFRETEQATTRHVLERVESLELLERLGGVVVLSDHPLKDSLERPLEGSRRADQVHYTLVVSFIREDQAGKLLDRRYLPCLELFLELF